MAAVGDELCSSGGGRKRAREQKGRKRAKNRRESERMPKSAERLMLFYLTRHVKLFKRQRVVVDEKKKQANFV